MLLCFLFFSLWFRFSISHFQKGFFSGAIASTAEQTKLDSSGPDAEFKKKVELRGANYNRDTAPFFFPKNI